jgi:PTS system fructose-specific IIC component
MAAEALEKAGKETNHTIKVETQGQSGVKNHLTKEEIQNAKAIIVAADTNVDLSRFNGKKLINGDMGTSVATNNLTKPKTVDAYGAKESTEYKFSYDADKDKLKVEWKEDGIDKFDYSDTIGFACAVRMR